jgi:hypothetical protein
VASQGSVILPLYRRLIENPNVSCDCRRRLWLKTAGGGVGQQVCTSLQLLNALQFTPSKGFKLLMSLIFLLSFDHSSYSIFKKELCIIYFVMSLI